MTGTGGDAFTIGVDPGRSKCGVAVIDSDGRAVLMNVMAKDALLKHVDLLTSKYDIDRIAVGDGTGSVDVTESLEKRFHGTAICIVDETNSTREGISLALSGRSGLGRFFLWLKFAFGLVNPDPWAALVIAGRSLKKPGK